MPTKLSNIIIPLAIDATVSLETGRESQSASTLLPLPNKQSLVIHISISIIANIIILEYLKINFH